MILKEIQQSIEVVTGEPLKGSLDNKKIFCGLARKHDNASQSKIAEYLQIPLSNISYYLKQHAILSKTIGYSYVFKQIEADLIHRCQ